MQATSARRFLILGLSLATAVAVGAGGAAFGACGPFLDFTDAAFCPFVLEIFYVGITTGTTPTTYDPASPVSRLQMAAFLSRTVDGVLKRGSRQAALNQFSGDPPGFVECRAGAEYNYFVGHVKKIEVR